MTRRRGATFLVLFAALAALLVVPGASGFGAAGGSADRGLEVEAVPRGPVVLIGTTGVRWRDLSTQDGGLTGEVPVEPVAPHLVGLLEGDRDGQEVSTDAVALATTTGAASYCSVGGWLSLSATELVRSAASSDAACPDPAVEPAATDADALDAEGSDADLADTEGSGNAVDAGSDGVMEVTVADWDHWSELQRGSTYGARLGRLNENLDGTCTTAVGARAAMALAGPDGTVERYADDVGPGVFECPLTVVDAGDALLTHPEIEDLEAEAAESLRQERVAAVDAEIRRVLGEVPQDATVVIADLANQIGKRPELGVGMVFRPADTDGYADERYLTSSATRTTGVARSMDLPATIVTAVGRTSGPGLKGTPLVRADPRPSAEESADALTDLVSRDKERRGAYRLLVEGAFWVVLGLAGACWWVGHRARRAATPVPDLWRRAAAGAALVLGALPVAGFLASMTGWWRFPEPGMALALAITAIAGLLAGMTALTPPRPVWIRPGVLAAMTFVTLTVDGLLDTPLNRAAPLGSAPSYAARFYGFGNPTFCVYAVSAVVLAAVLAQWLILRGRRGLATVVVAGIGLVALVVDVLPRFGADIGGAPPLVVAFVVLGFMAYGGRLRAGRIIAVTGAGALLVVGIGVADYLRPAAERSHLGLFVADVVDGEAWSILIRKAGYAARSLLSGPSVWVTVLVLVAVALVVFTPVLGRRIEPTWSRETRARWPFLLPTVAAIWILAVTGSLVNDFGMRVAMICTLVAVPLFTVAALHATAPHAGVPEVSGQDGEPEFGEATRDVHPR